MHITDTEMGLAFAAGRAIRQTEDAARAVVDQRNRQLKRATGRIATLESEVAALRRERTARGMRILAAAAVRNVH